MKKLLVAGLLILSTVALAQSKKKQDIEAIKSMCGCYEVTFNFAETFGYQRDYQYHDNYMAKALEWVKLVEDEKNKISLQHLLVVGGRQIVKHWRQDWIYENTDLYAYQGDMKWTQWSLPKSAIKGQWTQKVYHVDDSPRYEASASWVHTDGKHYWEGKSDSPLPRREYTKRSDYNVMIRRNRHELTDYGWLHEQDNDKVLRKEGQTDETLASEKGWNTYTKVDESQCEAAAEWWAKNEKFWADVRVIWDEVYASNDILAFETKIDDKLLYERIFELGDEIVKAADYDQQQIKKQVRDIINLYLD